MTESIEQRLRRHAAKSPDALAASSFHRQITAAELDSDADRVAAYLAEHNVGPGARVAYLGRNRVETPAVIVGLRRARCALVGANFRLTPPETSVALGLVEPDVVIVEPHLVGLLAEWRESAEHDLHIAVLGDEAGDHRWGDLGNIQVAPGDVPETEADPDDEAMIYYTSGTSGAPKAVAHRLAACELAAARHTHLGLGAGTTQLIVPPTFHVAGGLWSQFSVHAQSHQVLLSEASPTSLLTAIEQFGITHAVFVPTLIKILLDALDAAGDQAPSMRTLSVVAYGASPITRTLLDRAVERLGCDFFQAYGMTEMNGVVSQLLPADHHPSVEHSSRLRSAGQPVSDTEARVVEPGTSTPVVSGIDGELQFRGPLRMIGYVDNPTATADAFTDDGFFRSGDIGHFDDDGYLYITDRSSDIIITGGENVYPVEVENVLDEVVSVAESAVFGVPDEQWGELVVAVIVAAPGSVVDMAALDAHCSERLAGYKRPRKYHVVEQLPRNATGKILRRELPTDWS